MNVNDEQTTCEADDEYNRPFFEKYLTPPPSPPNHRQYFYSITERFHNRTIAYC